MVTGAQESSSEEGTSKRTLKEEQGPAVERKKRREGKGGREVKKERSETLKTALHKFHVKREEPRLRGQFPMSGEEKRETRPERKKTSDQEGSSARLKGLGMVLRAWGEEPPATVWRVPWRGEERNQGVQHGGGYSLQLSHGPKLQQSHCRGGKGQEERALRETEGRSDRTQPGGPGERERGED